MIFGVLEASVFNARPDAVYGLNEEVAVSVRLSDGNPQNFVMGVSFCNFFDRRRSTVFLKRVLDVFFSFFMYKTVYFQLLKRKVVRAHVFERECRFLKRKENKPV